MTKYSVIIPVYRGALTIRKLAYGIRDFFNSHNLPYELIFVYDNGPDNSWEEIQLLKSELGDNLKGIKLSRNFGQHNALICGFKHASGEYIITLDEDLQHNPQDILKLINKQKEKDYDVVYGKYNELKHSSFRNITSITLKKLLEISIPDLHPDYTAFRLIKSWAARQTLTMNNSYTFLDGYLSWVTTNVSSVTVSHEERIEGKSSYTLGKLINHAINIFVTFSLVPIRVLTYISFIIFLSSIFYTSYISFRKIFFQDLVPGYASTMIITGLGLGLTLFGLGIIGEYIHRINLKTTRKPNFLEKEII